jgi:methylated-DNA-protein-cysteine methyltransferase-like protein
MNQRVFTLYIRRHCQLCEQMLHALAPWCDGHDLALEAVDVDTDPVLAARYGERVPVLAEGEDVIAELLLDEAVLARRLGVAADGGLREAGTYPRIYALARQIPAGKVATYGQLAAIEGRATARMVGYAMAALPAGSDVPWQRVINARGEVSARSGGGGTARQRERLEAEGVYFDARGRVDLVRAGWDGPPAPWLARHGFHAAALPVRRADAVVPGAPARRARRML